MKFIHLGYLTAVSVNAFKNSFNPIPHNALLNNPRMFLHMKKEKKINFHSVYTPKNANQQLYVDYLNNPNTSIIVSIGPAGTGKTMFGCIKAIKDLQCGNINKIIITRPLVTVEEELGFLPGDILKKMDPWTRPIFDIFLEHISKTELNTMLYNGVIEISPLAFMRGRTFKNAFIIADEMQNSSPNQMKMLTSRLGENTKMVITGDLKQTDRQINNNGLYDFITKYKAYNTFMNETESEYIRIVEFETTDIERSVIVEKIINMYNFGETANTKTENKECVKCATPKNNDCAIIPLNLIPRNENHPKENPPKENPRKPRKIWEQEISS